MNHQTPENTIRLPAITDAQVIRLMGSLAELSEEAGAAFNIRSFHAELGQARTANEFFESYPADWRKTRIISSADVSMGATVYVRFNRHVTQFVGGQAQAVQLSSWESEVWIQFNQNHEVPSAAKLLGISKLIDKLKTDAPSVGVEPGSQMRDVFATQVAALTDLQTQMLSDLEAERARRDREFSEREAAREAEFNRRREELESELRAQGERLQHRQDELEEARKALDDRGHMHARRELRAQITNDLKGRLSKPGVGAAVGKQRLSIFLGGGALLAAFAWLAWISSNELGSVIKAGQGGANALTFMLMGRFAIAAAGIAGLGFYLLGYARTLHDTDLQTDRDLERYRYDLDRASWAIETILEAQSKDGGPEAGIVPDEWIAGATHGLFAKSDQRSGDHAAMEALGSLLNFAAEAEIGPGGPRLKLTKRGISKLKRSGYVAEGVD